MCIGIIMPSSLYNQFIIQQQRVHSSKGVSVCSNASTMCEQCPLVVAIKDLPGTYRVDFLPSNIASDRRGTSSRYSTVSLSPEGGGAAHRVTRNE